MYKNETKTVNEWRRLLGDMIAISESPFHYQWSDSDEIKAKYPHTQIVGRLVYVDKDIVRLRTKDGIKDFPIAGAFGGWTCQRGKYYMEKVLELDELGKLSMCKNAKAYKGMRPPICNGKNPCLVCLAKFNKHYRTHVIEEGK
jgi:hypothetical protein